MPKNSESLGNIESSAEAIRAQFQKRGDEANRAYQNDPEALKKREALLREIAELEEKLRNAGVELEEVPEGEDEEVPAAPAKASETFEAPETSGATETSEKVSEQPEEDYGYEPVSPESVANKAKKHKGLRTFITGITLAVATAITAGGLMVSSATKTQAAPTASTTAATATSTTISGGGGSTTSDTRAARAEQMYLRAVADAEANVDKIQQTDVSGETINGVSYDYHEYADRDNKVSYNAFGYDYSDQYENREKTTEGILHMASTEPEALAAYAYNALTDDEKAELGIKGLTMSQIDDKFDEAGGGALQKSILEKFSSILKDKTTRFDFYLENDTEQTNYIYFVDKNGDGVMTPDELHIAYDTKKRDNAPQVDIYRTLTNADGTTKEVKVLDLNMRCGYQPNYEVAPKGVQKVGENKKTDEKTDEISGGGGITTPDDNPSTPDKPDKPDKPDNPTPPNPPDPPTPPTPPTPPDPPVPPVPPTPRTPPEPEKPAPKDGENLERIDDQILDDIADDIGTGEVIVTPNPGVSDEDLTEKPSGDDYQGTEAETKQNEASEQAEQVQQQVSEENDYSEDRGGANEGNANEHPVQPNDEGQSRADEGEKSESETPHTSEEAKDTLSDLGIN